MLQDGSAHQTKTWRKNTCLLPLNWVLFLPSNQLEATTGQRRSWKQDEYGSRGACRLERWFFTPVGCGGWCLSPDDPVLRSQHMLNKFVGLIWFDTYLPWHPTTWIILRWISVGRPLGPQDVTCVQRGDPEQRVTTCYSHPGKEMPKFYLASWREDSINLVCKVKNKSSKTWRSKSYSARNPISISMLTSSFQTWSPKKTAGNDPKRHHLFTDQPGTGGTTTIGSKENTWGTTGASVKPELLEFLLTN